MYPTPIQRRPIWLQRSYRISLPIALLLWLLPLIAIALTSIRSISDINAGNYFGLPDNFSLFSNYTEIFTQTKMATYLINSFLIVIPAVFGCLVVSTMAGFALAKYHFKGSIWLFAIFIAGNFVPFQILMIPVRDLTIKLGLYDTIFALIFFHMAFQTGFCTLFMKNFIEKIPTQMMEAARVDGVSEIKIFIHIILPLVRPAICALCVLVFTFVWNDFFWSLILVQSDEVRPVTAGLNSLKGQWLSSFQLMSAGSIVAALPCVAIFFMMQKHFVVGLTLGANKG